MVVMEKRPELNLRSGYKMELRVERTGISFQDLAGDMVRIQVTVHNPGEHRSRTTVMRLESAPLGAFLRWRPLTHLIVPPLEPGESRDVTAKVPRPRPAPLGTFNNLPPKKLLTAINSPDTPSPSGRLSAMADLFRQIGRSTGGDKAGGTSMAPDLWDLVGRGQTHWAGNINVFIGRQRVERHFSKALRVYPGRTNLAMFLVGHPARSDAFCFELRGLAPDWEAALYDMGNQASLLVGPSDAPIKDAEWVESIGGMMVVLATHPPANCTSGSLEVHITRRSSGETAVVEFDLNPAAAGPGCYFL